ncbi:MAG: isochorismate synthase MenF [Actinomycetota bacterium]
MLDREAHVPANVPAHGGFLWWHRGDGFAGWGEAARVPVGSEPARFERAGRDLARLFARVQTADPDGPVPIGVGSFSFDRHEPGSILVVPQVVVRGTDVTIAGAMELPVIAHEARIAPAVDRARYAGADISELAWLEAVSDAIRDVSQGQLSKVVLARDELVWARAPFDEGAIASRLIDRFPDCYTFVCGGLIGASPELLVRKVGRHVESVVLAGSAPRGSDAATDDRLAQRMLDSNKERDEHGLSVTSVVEGLRSLCSDVEVEDTPHLMRLANLQHLATSVRARADATMSVLDLVGALHPTAAVCGAPRSEALARIRSVEGRARGRYGGPVGWVDARGDGEWAIALRCAQVDGTRARLFAGAGIVAGSMPEEELEETRLKLRAMQEALGAG